MVATKKVYLPFPQFSQVNKVKYESNLGINS